MVGSEAVKAVAGGLKSQPLAFALVLVNLLFIGSGVWVLRDVAINARERAEAEKKLLSQVLSDCGIKKPESRDAR